MSDFPALPIVEIQISQLTQKFPLKFGHLTEHLDDPYFPVKKKINIVYGLHLKNKIFGTYKKLYKSLLPLIEQINRDEKRPARILEIASGLGYLTLGLYQEIRGKSQIELTGSDIVPDYVHMATKNAKKLGYNVDFKVIDALSLQEQEASWDIIINLHSLHHFAPLQLAQIFRAASIKATRGFYALDGSSHIWNRLFIAAASIFPTLFFWDFCYFHDASISALKMYSPHFLGSCAQIATDPNQVEVSFGLRSVGLNFISIMKKRKQI